MNSSPSTFANDLASAARNSPAGLPDMLEWLPRSLCDLKTTGPQRYRRLLELRYAIQNAATGSPSLPALVRELCDLCRNSPLPA